MASYILMYYNEVRNDVQEQSKEWWVFNCLQKPFQAILSQIVLTLSVTSPFFVVFCDIA